MNTELSRPQRLAVDTLLALRAFGSQGLRSRDDPMPWSMIRIDVSDTTDPREAIALLIADARARQFKWFARLPEPESGDEWTWMDDQIGQTSVRVCRLKCPPDFIATSTIEVLGAPDPEVT